MKLLITGGNGFIGRNLHKMFSSEGWEVISPGHCELDILNIDALSKFFNQHKFDTVIHTSVKGGKLEKEDTYQDLKDNLIMYENITEIVNNNCPIIIYGSGAEFDRRFPINIATEKSVIDCWPIDPYGLSKNLITRRSMSDCNKVSILRLFGCFHASEEESRFIKRSINRLKQGLSIEIHKNKQMDFFSLEDVFTVTKHIIKQKITTNMNLVYPEKRTLFSIACLIHKYTKIFKPPISFIEKEEDKPYTGNGLKLQSYDIHLIGLEESIKRMVQSLL